ncbi:flavodoxin family protein [Brachyspira pulli]|uniref:flavodoxin family protein n=1 Tax=Brachyspira pulli TaxID=310721 RepID=UPI0026379C4D|nr:flavodoxin family protein [uncultured Brachyspira sp.]
MSKKVLIISSSPRRGGNSDLLCDEFLKGAKEAGHDAEKIFLKDKKINYCEDCGTCYKNNKPCVQKDDMKEILDKMLEADVIVMATPVYFYTMNAQMKTFIDRCVTKYLEIKNKDFYFIATAATEDEKEMVRTIDGFRGFLDCLEDVREKGVILAHSVWNKEEVKDKKYMQDAYNLGLNV